MKPTAMDGKSRAAHQLPPFRTRQAYHNNWQPVLSYDPTALVKLLNWVGGANLVELMLPTVVAFHYDAAMGIRPSKFSS